MPGYFTAEDLLKEIKKNDCHGVTGAGAVEGVVRYRGLMRALESLCAEPEENKIPITLEIRGPDGEMVEEQNIVVSKGDTLILQFNDVQSFVWFMRLDEEDRQKVVDQYKKAIQEGGGVLVLGPGVKIMALHKEGFDGCDKNEEG